MMWWLATAWAVDVRSEVLRDAPVAARVSPSPADLVVAYAADHHAQLEACGCQARPLGSVARLGGWWAASADPARVVVYAGYALEADADATGALLPDVARRDHAMRSALGAMHVDAILLTPADADALARLPPDPLPWVAADVSGPGVAREVRVERNGLRVGITGISAPADTWRPPAGFARVAEEDVRRAVRTLADQVDVLVLLDHGAADEARALARAVPGVDVVVDADHHVAALPAADGGRAVWTYAAWEGRRAGELRLTVRDGRVTAAVDRQVELDEAVPEDPGIAALVR